MSYVIRKSNKLNFTVIWDFIIKIRHPNINFVNVEAYYFRFEVSTTGTS